MYITGCLFILSCYSIHNKLHLTTRNISQKPFKLSNSLYSSNFNKRWHVSDDVRLFSYISYSFCGPSSTLKLFKHGTLYSKLRLHSKWSRHWYSNYEWLSSNNFSKVPNFGKVYVSERFPFNADMYQTITGCSIYQLFILWKTPQPYNSSNFQTFKLFKQGTWLC